MYDKALLCNNHRKEDIDKARKSFTISTNPSVNNTEANRCEMEIANAAYSAQDTVDLQTQEQMATIHVNPSTSEDLIKDGMSNPTYVVQLNIPGVKEIPYSCDTEQTHT